MYYDTERDTIEQPSLNVIEAKIARMRREIEASQRRAAEGRALVDRLRALMDQQPALDARPSRQAGLLRRSA